jgi:hypothetical protein
VLAPRGNAAAAGMGRLTATMSVGFPVACLNIHDVELLVVFVDQSPLEKREIYSALHDRAKRAGLTGDIVAVWQDEFGRTRFIAPPEQHAFFQITGYDQLYAQINSKLEC